MTAYACPKCGSTDLRVEIPFVHVLHPDGTLDPCDYAVERIEDVTDPGTTMCQNDECEHTGAWVEFLQPAAS